MYPRQLYASLFIGLVLFILIVRLVQKGRLDIAYSWIWLSIGIGMMGVILWHDILLKLSELIDSRTATTTLFLIGFVVVLLMCLQFSLVISAQKRQIRKLTQRLALIEKTPPGIAKRLDARSDDEPTA